MSEVRSVLSLGGNLGDRSQTLQSALEQLGATPKIKLLKFSEAVESYAVTAEGIDPEAPRYLNLVAEIQTSLKPKALLKAVNRIENDHGRVRIQRWAARTLDIDIITYGTELLQKKSLMIPHPRAHERGFVLVPWADMDSSAVLPGHGSVQVLAEGYQSEVWYLK